MKNIHIGGGRAALTKSEALKTYFGYDAFREGQETVVDALLSGRDAFAVMPTGAGKSLCFQLPALLLPGLTLVVSPLISLMKDQVAALSQAGVPAAFLNSSLTEGQLRKATAYAKAGRYKIIYVAPERLLTDRFAELAQCQLISLVAVDEAHCVSQWGQDFRPHYLHIPDFIASLPTRPVVAAFTATATQRVRRDVVTLLQMQNPERVVTGFDRANLFFETQTPKDKRATLLAALRAHEGSCAIVYASTRKTVEEVCGFLTENGVSATRYHAGLSPQERKENQEAWLFDRRRVMVATNAFGMGIDKSNVRLVLHYNMPKDMESYYQEAGRAGRDGLSATCLLLFGKGDVSTNRFFILHQYENDELSAEDRRARQRIDLQRLGQMVDYCQTTVCLRQTILRYFGEEAPDECGRCSGCVPTAGATDITREARILLSCVARTGGRLTDALLVDVLRGAQGQEIEEQGLFTQSTYGLLHNLTPEALRTRIDALLQEGALLSDGATPPHLRLGPAAGPLLHGQKRLLLQAPPTPQSRRKAADGLPEGPGAAALYQALKALRGRLARRQGVPAFVVFSDASLMDMCRRLPRTETEFLFVSGVGDKKLRQYGAAFLAEIDAHLRKTTPGE